MCCENVDGDYDIMIKYVHKSENTASRIIDGQAVIMTLNDNTLHTLNEVGSRIWELCDGKKTLEDIVGVIDEEYIVDNEMGKTDCEAFVKKLCTKGMLMLQVKRTKD